MSRLVRRPRYRLRGLLVRVLLLGGLGLMGARAFYLQVYTSGYLQEQGNARHLRVVEDNSHRGMILDRNGEPLAISTPIDSVWANPIEFGTARGEWPGLARLLGMSLTELQQQLSRHAGREFMYLKRHITPELAGRVMALNIPGVALQREYRRYYPAGQVAGHVVGFTNIDDQGQEGLELAYNTWLHGVPGKKRVLKDRLGNVVETVESVSLPEPGKDLTISIDRRIQYLAYRELKAAVQASDARGGSVIVLDAHTGEVLALVNEPGFNPNNRGDLKSQLFRNRAVTDMFEPGSTLKPFTIAAALESGKYSVNTPIDTSPGEVRIGHNTVHDTRNHGRLTVAQVIEKSSNVGASKIALSLDKRVLWDMLTRVGFGQTTAVGLPGEANGLLNPPARWVPIEQATISFGYGISVTPLQLAQAYAVLANDGVLVPLSLLRRDEPAAGKQVLGAQTARQVRAMLELAVSSEGTGSAAQVGYYQVAGKTGTAHKLAAQGYAENIYIASFAGFAPASDPRLVMVVIVDEPSRGAYFGGQIAAPVFSKVMAGALRLLNIPPDAVQAPRQRSAQRGADGNTAVAQWPKAMQQESPL